MFFDDFWQSLYGGLDSFTSSDESKRQYYFSVFEVEFLFRQILVKSNVRHSVFNANNFIFIDLVNIHEEVNSYMTHHHNFMRYPAYLLQNCFFIVGRLFQYGMKGYNQRDFKPAE